MPVKLCPQYGRMSMPSAWHGGADRAHFSRPAALDVLQGEDNTTSDMYATSLRLSSQTSFEGNLQACAFVYGQHVASRFILTNISFGL